MVVGPANRNDHLLLAATPEAVVVPRPEPGEATPQRLCVDLGYAGQPAQEVIAAHHDEPHVRRIGLEKLYPAGEPRYPARRWVVEWALSCLSRWRGILVRWEKQACNCRALLQLACALLWYRRWWRLRGAI